MFPAQMYLNTSLLGSKPNFMTVNLDSLLIKETLALIFAHVPR